MHIHVAATESVWMNILSLPVTMWSGISAVDCVLKASTDRRHRVFSNCTLGSLGPLIFMAVADSFRLVAKCMA